MSNTKRRFGAFISIMVVFGASIGFIIAEYNAQKCVTDTIMTQIGFVDTAGVNATVPPAMKEIVDNCGFKFSMMGALFLAFSSVAAATLGVFSYNRFFVEHPIKISAHYEPDTCKLILRSDRPIITQNPHRMILLYKHVDGIAAVVPSRQCGGSGLILAFIIDVEKPPIRMELVICSGAMHPVGFPESDVCVGGRPIHLDVDMLHCEM